jgi:hypothetical protein
MQPQITIPDNRRSLVLAISLMVFIGLAVAVASSLPDGIDWELTYRPAALAMLQGRNPYDSEVAPEAPFFAAPWGLLPLIPLAVLPVEIGRALLLFISMGCFAYTAKRLGAGLAGVVAFTLSPPVVHCLLNANVEWLPLLGFVLPPQLGLFFISVKPQTGFAVGLFWFVEAWRRGGWREVVRIFAPVTIALLLSFGLYGLWPFRFSSVLGIAQNFNASLWPMSLPIGLALLVAAIRTRKVEYAMPASPCLSPYVLFHSWSSAVVALSSRTPELITAVIGLWIVVILRGLG